MPAARPGIGMPGSMLTVSCNRADPGTGVLWALHPVEGDANHATVAGMLQAYRAVRSVQLVSAVGSLFFGCSGPAPPHPCEHNPSAPTPPIFHLSLTSPAPPAVAPSSRALRRRSP